MNVLVRVILALNQGTCFVLTGQNDFTLSGWAHYRRYEEGVELWANVINKIFFWQENHCLSAFIGEWEESRNIQKDFYACYSLAKLEKATGVKQEKVK